MRVYISVDAEGISGIVKLSQVIPASADYSFCRSMMINDVNAAIRGAFNAGATEVIINDAHHKGDNIQIDKLDSRAKLISGTDRPLIMMQGIDMGFDAALLIGYHSSKGNKGVISHTYFYSIIEVTINKVPVSEYEINGLLAGYFKIPVVFISGDNELVKDARKNIPGVYSTVTKEAIGTASALCYHPDITKKSIEENVEKALRNYKNDNIKPMTTGTDKIELEIQFPTTGHADYASGISGFELVKPNRVKFVANNYMDMFKAFYSALLMSKSFNDMD